MILATFMKTLTTAQLKANPRNPRKITDKQLASLKAALAKFGDLSGLIFNETTGHLVGGHQRIKLLGDLPVQITQRYKKPTAHGTVAEGFVVYEGERFVYRAVKWDEAMEQAAMIAANKHGGEWDLPGLAQLLVELDKHEFNLDLTGFEPTELEKLINSITEGGEIETSELENIDVLPGHVRMVQLFLTVDTLPTFLDQVRALQKTFSAHNITDAVVAAVNQCYSHHHDNPDSAQSEASTNQPGIPAKKRSARKGVAANNGAARRAN